MTRSGPPPRARRPHTTRHLARLVLGILGILGMGPGAADAAVADFVGRTIASVRLVIEGRETTDPALVQVVETLAGRQLAMAQVRESITHLFSLGRFEDVRADAVLTPAGVVLVYELRPVHPVTKIVFEGSVDLPGVDVGQLRRAVVDRYGGSPLVARTADMVATMQEALRERGYLHAAINPRTEIEHAPDRSTLVFAVDPGARTEIGLVTIVGTGPPPADLVDDLRLTKGAPYEADALDARIARYIDAQKNRGYYEAKVTRAVLHSENDRVANITLTLIQGPKVRVVFTGDALPADRRRQLVPIEEEGSADEDLLEDSTNRIQDELRGQGYRDATAPHTRAESNGELVITFDVHRGALYQVNRVEITGNASVPLDAFQSGLRLRDGEAFSDARLDGDIATIEDFYHRRGFPSARAEAEVETRTPELAPGRAGVVVHVNILEGPRTVVGTIGITGNASVPSDTLRTSLGLQPGGPYFDEQLRADADAIQARYATFGYQSASVEASPNFTADRTQANPVFSVREGPQLVIDHVLIVGNVRTRVDTIERELQLRAGDPLNPSAVLESQRRLASLGLFRRIRITELRHGEASQRDLLVTVEEAPATTVGYGGGFEVRLRVVRGAEDVAADELQFAPRASFEIGRRNVFGKNRSVNLFTSLSLHPKGTSEGGYGFPEYRVEGVFREPHVLDTEADAFITGTLTQQRRSSFNFSRRGVNGEVARHLTRELSVSGGYQIQRAQVFDSIVNEADQHLVDRLFPQVRLSSFSSSAIYDSRDDQVDPTRGDYVSVNGQLAARRIGSEVGFSKTFITAQLFRTPPRARRFVLAGSARLGLADGFPRSVGLPVQVVEDVPASERFFAGGDTTVRGYALDTLGTTETKDQDRFPIGGNALVIFNAEARINVWRGVQAVPFLDIGNVFARPTDVDFGMLKTAVGVGLRYKSPVGPIRIDLGFKLQREEIAPGRREGLTALHISLGQAF